MRRTAAAGLSFHPAELADPAAHPELWEKVLQKVRTGQMPPAGRPRPDAATLATFQTRWQTASISRPPPVPTRAAWVCIG
jgi:hypothetical protein